MFPYPVAVIISVWFILIASYLVCRWRQKSRSIYIIPRVFVLCSPRTVQFHYELILRIGLPSYDFNPDKHDVDISLLGQQKNEVVPVTRLNTKTLLDEPLITSLSLVVYRLVEMPNLGGIVLKHSGPFKAWLYAYDFTVIDLITNREYYYALNQYIGALDRVLPLDEPNASSPVEYPIDDVPLPPWSIEDIFLILFTTVNSIMLLVTMMPINCVYTNDLLAVLLSAFGSGMLLFFLDWLLYYYLSWNQDRKEYFNDPVTPAISQIPATGVSRYFCALETMIRIAIAVVAALTGAASIYMTISITDWQESLVWFLALINSIVLVLGFWNIARQLDLGSRIVNLGLKTRGIEETTIGMHYSEMVPPVRTKSGSSTSDSGISSAVSGMNSTKTNGRMLGPRSSVKSFGFDPVSGQPSRAQANHNHRQRIISRLQARSRVSATGATPNNQPGAHIMRSLPARASTMSRIHHSDKPSSTHSEARSQISRLTSSQIEPTDSTTKHQHLSQSQSQSQSKSQSQTQHKETGEKTAKHEHPAKRENSAKQEHPAKRENSAKQEHPAKRENSAKQEHPAKHENSAKHEHTTKHEHNAK